VTGLFKSEGKRSAFVRRWQAVRRWRLRKRRHAAAS
jgi:hypothetical protein